MFEFFTTTLPTVTKNKGNLENYQVCIFEQKI